MSQQEVMALRDLHASDEDSIRRILDTSEYVHFHFDIDQLSRLLERYPAVGAFSVPAGPLGRISGGTLQAFLLINWLAPPSAWLGGFGVTWSQGSASRSISIRYWSRWWSGWRLVARNRSTIPAATSITTGSAIACRRRGFTLTSLLRSYDKTDFAMPSDGNTQVQVRPFTPEDLPGVLAVEQDASPRSGSVTRLIFSMSPRRIPTSSSPKTRAGSLATSSTRWMPSPAISCASRCIRARGVRASARG